MIAADGCVAPPDGVRRPDGARSAATAAGLKVTALLKRGGNERGERVADEEMRRLRLTPHAVYPAWNYTLVPRPTDTRLERHFVLC